MSWQRLAISRNRAHYIFSLFFLSFFSVVDEKNNFDEQMTSFEDMVAQDPKACQ